MPAAPPRSRSCRPSPRPPSRGAPSGIVAHDLLGQQASQFILGNARRNDRQPDRFGASFRERCKEAEVGVAVDRVHDTVGGGLANLFHGCGKVAVAQRHILFAYRLEALRLQVFLGDEVGRPRVDIVGADQKDPLLLSAGGARTRRTGRRVKNGRCAVCHTESLRLGITARLPRP